MFVMCVIYLVCIYIFKDICVVMSVDNKDVFYKDGDYLFDML